MPKKILICDDTLFMRVTLKNILSNSGYQEILQAENGQDALQKYAANKPDLVLMDITMPVLDGISATKQIKAKFPDAKIAMCTALGQKNMVIEAIQAGAKDFIVKPFTPDKVIETVQRLIGTADDEEVAKAA
jgi:two-component system chemotaxis response regulator CheY